jgi:hypothetical protein
LESRLIGPGSARLAKTDDGVRASAERFDAPPHVRRQAARVEVPEFLDCCVVGADAALACLAQQLSEIQRVAAGLLPAGLRETCRRRLAEELVHHLPDAAHTKRWRLDPVRRKLAEVVGCGSWWLAGADREQNSDAQTVQPSRQVAKVS